MQKILNLLFVAVALATSVVSTGCVAIVAGGAAAGGTAYAMGDLKGPVEASPKELRSAIVAGTNDLGLRRISGAGDELEGKYVYRTGADEKVTIRYKAVSDELLEMFIRVGTFGDESMSLRISEAIRSHL